MKKTMFALAALGALASGSAFAQQAGDLVIGAGWFHLSPQDSSKPLTAAGWSEGPLGAEVERTALERPLLRNGTFWSDHEWIDCHDGKTRRAQSGIRFLVDGLPGRVDLWRVGGNAIVPVLASEVISSFMEVYP